MDKPELFLLKDDAIKGEENGYKTTQKYGYSLKHKELPSGGFEVVYVFNGTFYFDDFPTSFFQSKIYLKGAISSEVNVNSILQANMSNLDALVYYKIKVNDTVEEFIDERKGTNIAFSSLFSTKKDNLSYEVFRPYVRGLERYDYNMLTIVINKIKIKHGIDIECGKKEEKPLSSKKTLVSNKEEKLPLKDNVTLKKSDDIISEVNLTELYKEKLEKITVRDQSEDLYSKLHLINL